LAVIATLTKGYDLDYIWKQVDQGPAKDAAGYYIQASESGGEPPGRWWGHDALALGLEPGQIVERKPYDLLFGKRQAPDGTSQGRPPGSGRKAAGIYESLLEAEPRATAERKRELRLDATRQARQSPMYFDLPLSLSKSISIFHASLGENARLARQAGDAAGDVYWSGLVAQMDEMIWQAVRAGFGYFQGEAGYTHTGSHSRRVGDRETGQWHEADLAVAHWCSTPPATVTCSCTSTPRSRTSPAPAPTGSGGPRTPSATTSTSARSPPSTWRSPSPPGSGWSGPPATMATADEAVPHELAESRAAQQAVALAQQESAGLPGW
jgi:hypothetical protein